MARHDYRMGLVGNCAFAAHVDDEARVVWLCWPRFDSDFVFGALLDRERGGELSVLPAATVERTTQAYVRNTNVLTTEVVTSEGSYRVTDCAPRYVEFGRAQKPLWLVRKLEPLEGTPRVRVRCRPRGDYGRLAARATFAGDHLRYELGDRRVLLYGTMSSSHVLGEQAFVLSRPEYLLLTYDLPLESPVASTCEELLARTIAYWHAWVRGCAIGRFYQEEVIRSALVLKLHQFEDTGAIIAAATTSLPEAPGSGRTWDYRYCWLRDAYYTLSALSRIGQFEEMLSFANFIENVAASVGRGRLPPVVAIDGTLELPERFVELAGYDGAGQVRVGNAAFSHVQHDVYGQVINALLQLYVDERLAPSRHTGRERLIRELLERIDKTLDEPDNSLWELRGRNLHHGYTALFHWVGAKAAAKIARSLDDKELVRFAAKLTTRAARRVEACYDPALAAYAQEPGSSAMDASLLQLVSLHFLDPASARAAAHVAATKSDLATKGGLLLRYRSADDFGVPANSFLVCAFWHVEALAVMGKIDDALELFETLLKYQNHLGLLSEHVDAETGSQWGNFPQTYSHVGLMNSVMRIASRIDYPEFF